MFYVGAVAESIKRHLVAILLIFALAIGAGVGSSFLKTGDEAKEISEKAYTAEAVLYFTMEGTDTSIAYSVSDVTITDARRTVISDKVAGEIRRTFGSEVTITSPWWVDEEKNARYYSHYIFVDASAPTEEVALAAANAAATRAASVIQEVVPVKSVVVAETAYVKQGDSSQASDRGTEALENIESAVVTSSGISAKKLLIFGFLGLFGSIFVFACLDILSRRVRSERDIERLLDLSVLGTAKSDDDLAGIAAALGVILSRNNLESVAVAGVCAADGAVQVCQKVAGALSQKAVCVETLLESSAIAAISECQAVALVLTEGAASGKQIDKALKTLRIADVPVAGVVFIPKGKK